jgi:2,3-bisphosphoglycerate-independent phosphoglycerate mutase
MKFLMMLVAGLADEPVESLDNRTPLDSARTPALDELARHGKTGCIRTLFDDLPASEEVALLSCLGYDPHKYFCGEAGLALADSGLRVGRDQLAFMHNLVTESNGLLVDHAAGQITPKEAEALLTSLAAALGRPEINFWPGRGFTGVTVLPVPEGGEPECAAPETVLGEPIAKYLPVERETDIVRKVIETSREVFKEHEVNRIRADLNENPANALWLWGPGRAPVLPPFESRHGLFAAMVAASESARGLGRLCSMRVPHVPGATGSYRTDYAAKAQHALELIEEFDLVVIHVASPAEAALEGNVERKVSAIGDIDAMLVTPLFERAAQRGDVRVLFASTHLASCARRRRLRTETPVAIFGPGIQPLRSNPFTEGHAAIGELGVEDAHDFLTYYLTR